MENVPFEGVFPIENGDIPSSYVILPEGSSPFVGFASLKNPRLLGKLHVSGSCAFVVAWNAGGLGRRGEEKR